MFASMLHAIALSALLLAQPNVWTTEERQLLLDGLNKTRDLVIEATKGLAPAQWQFKEAPTRWSIAEVVEHLGLQEDMYFREMYLIAQQPPMPDLRSKVQNNDAKILAYADSSEKAQASWYLEPRGRWQDPANGVAAFLRSREHLTSFVQKTSVDLRVHFTFREYKGQMNQWSVRDLHQLMLTTISHTKRHVGQIERIKAHSNYPQRRTAAQPR